MPHGASRFAGGRTIKQLEIQKKHFENVLSHLRAGNAEMAAKVCDVVLQKFPDDANLLCLAARANIALRQFDRARSRIDEALRLFPDFAVAHETQGDLLLLQGQPGEALRSYEQSLRLNPAQAALHDKIARARKLAAEGKQGRGAACGAQQHADEIRKALEFEKNGDPRSAEAICREILKKDPDHPEAARILAGIASLNKRYRDAEILLKHVVKNVPAYTRAWVELANVQRELQELDKAVESARKVLELEPDKAESYLVYASAIGTAGKHEEAIEAYEKALAISPDRAPAACGLAHHQKTIGQTDKAIDSYRRAIAIKADHAEAYWSLANLKTFRFEDHEVAAMQRLLEDASLPDESRAQLHNALGLHFEACKDYARAFPHFRDCNRSRRKLETYDPVETEDTYGRTIDLFTPAFLEERAAAAADASVTPILIVGLPRSGSTLIEQILASHSQVDGTHELSDLQRAIQKVRRSQRRRESFPEALAQLSANDWRGIGEQYLETTRIHRGDAPYFVDKNPNNFVYAGVLKIALPHAKIIDARRHPLDSCLGSYKQLFASGQPFSYDMTELGEYYLQYRRLMEHWRQVLPGFVLDVHYEDVVGDFETQVRRLLDFCGLPFEEACLRFHETERAIRTASSEQVRRPIYASSVNLWRRYEPQLGELIEVLEPLLAALPASERPSQSG